MACQVFLDLHDLLFYFIYEFYVAVTIDDRETLAYCFELEQIFTGIYKSEINLALTLRKLGMSLYTAKQPMSSTLIYT